jgi:hypothetical protein
MTLAKRCFKGLWQNIIFFQSSSWPSPENVTEATRFNLVKSFGLKRIRPSLTTSKSGQITLNIHEKTTIV